MPGKIISIVNFKGGVGKTTLSVNVAACIAEQHRDKKVAIIDLDPQSNSSIWMLSPARWQEFNRPECTSNTSFAMFLGTITQSAFVVPYNDQKSDEYLPNLFLLPATYHMISLEKKILHSMANKKLNGKYRNGDEYLFLYGDSKVLREWFDYVLIDCPPNLYFGTLNAVCHSDYILVPCVPDTLSTMGLTMLVDEIVRTVEPLMKRNVRYRPPRILGVAITRLKAQTIEHTKGMDIIQTRIQEYLRHEHLLISDRTRVFREQPIREYVVHSEAVQDGLPLCFCAPKISAYTDIRNFTEAFLEAMEAEE